MNVELLKKVRDYIVKHPNRFVMDAYLFTPENSGIKNGFEADDGEFINFDKCGTAACIAGWTCLIKEEEVVKISGNFPFHGAGRDHLELTEDQAGRLFYTDDWPEPYRGNYQDADDQSARSRIAAARIDHFIATDGKE